MEKYEISKEQITEAHKSACGEWKAKIESWWPEVFKNEFKVGRWYKNKYNETWFFQGVKVSTYGFLSCGNFQTEVDIIWDEKLTPATPQEVETALINEAKKRGLIPGAKVKYLYNKEKGGINISLGRYDYEEVPAGEFQDKMALRDSHGNILFIDGQWATIIPQQIELSMQEIADKFNIDVENLKIKK